MRERGAASECKGGRLLVWGFGAEAYYAGMGVGTYLLYTMPCADLSGCRDADWFPAAVP